MAQATIFALATGVGRAAVAIVRLSGPRAGEILERLSGPLPRPRRAVVRTLRDPDTGLTLDHALVLWFPGPGSFTGEDVVELQLHGGRAVVTAVLTCLGAQAACRIALPGEFSRRAFLNRRLDLPALEGMADLIDAETEAQRKQAQRHLDGAMRDWVAVQRDTLLGALAAAESAIDFSDEGDVAGDFAREVQRAVHDLETAVDRELGAATRGAQVRDGLMVVLAGPPNAGKSTLLNALAQRDAAIVSPYPGTTRDPIEVALDLDGHLIRVIDTAGLRETRDPLEQEGIARTRRHVASADLVLWLTDCGDPVPADPAWDGVTVWTIGTKADLAPAAPDVPFDHTISALSGEGLAGLVAALRRFIAGAAAQDGGVVTRERHRAALVAASAALRAVSEQGPDAPIELAAEQLRRVAAILDGLVGTLTTEDVLGAIFARFCVGK